MFKPTSYMSLSIIAQHKVFLGIVTVPIFVALKTLLLLCYKHDFPQKLKYSAKGQTHSFFYPNIWKESALYLSFNGEKEKNKPGLTSLFYAWE